MTWWMLAIVATLAFVACWAGTRAARRHALARGIMDVPNARSSHTIPVPRGGGIAIVATVGAFVAVALAIGWIPGRVATAWLVGGGTIALVGYVDDRGGVGPRWRLLAHLFGGCCVLIAVGGLPPLPVFGSDVDLGYAGWVIGVLAIAWSINLFNFMDGIDGIAAAQAVFVAVAGAALWAVIGATPESLAASVTVAAASAGFLVWNRPPARIFMGDAGSGFLGFAIALLAFASWRAGGPSPWVWLLLHGAFVSDSLVTLVVRLLGGERVWEAHRRHAYQRLSRHWKSHARVTALYSAVNVLWFLPLAWGAVRLPGLAPILAIAGLAPAIGACAALGAGREGEITRLVPGTTAR